MKKLFAALLICCLLVPVCCMAEGEVKMGQVEWAAHGLKSVAVLTVAMQDDVIIGAYVDEFQVLNAAEVIGMPNSDADFGNEFNEGRTLASKRVNNEYYSAVIKNAGATNTLLENYNALEAYVTGKTIAELEAVVAATSYEEMPDVVSGCTLKDTMGYVTGLIEAAKAAK